MLVSRLGELAAGGATYGLMVVAVDYIIFINFTYNRLTYKWVVKKKHTEDKWGRRNAKGGNGEKHKTVPETHIDKKMFMVGGDRPKVWDQLKFQILKDC